MNFISLQFILFLLVLFLISTLAPIRFRKIILLVASYVFYATWSLPFIAVILITTTFDYGMSHIIQNAPPERERRRKLALVAGLGVNLLILAFFKYTPFLLDNGYTLAKLFGYAGPPPMALSIILPLGISFYTFEAISYLVDVYRGKPAAANLLDYNFYIMYFPHLISGPIIRFCELWPQYARPLQLPAAERLRQGLELILLGFLFKMLLADQAAQLVDPVFNAPLRGSALQAVTATLGFAVQIYFDFMGYTHIARGASLLFNIALPLNFNHPYNATNISNFWERWHMSLSRWIRDYLYFPLGGSRVGLHRAAINLVITMLIAGAWHGAGWTYIAWGGFHGLLLAGYHYYKALRDNMLRIPISVIQTHRGYRFASWLLTFCAVLVGWVFFRADNFSSAAIILQKIANPLVWGTQLAHEVVRGHFNELLQVSGLLFCCLAGPWIIQKLANVYYPLPFWLKVQTACFMLLLAWVLSSETIHPFIYFQF